MNTSPTEVTQDNWSPPVCEYVASLSEIERKALDVAQQNHPNILRIEKTAGYEKWVASKTAT